MKLNKLTIIVVLCLLLLLSGCELKPNKKSENLNIVVTIFPEYDFVKQIVNGNDNVNVNLLIKPGSESHNYEPTPQDIISIMDSDIFIYVGGESDEWVSKILKNIDISKTSIIKLMDIVDNIKEEEVNDVTSVDGNDNDEHVWTNPLNAIKIVKVIEKELERIDNKNTKLYRQNLGNYIDELKKLDSEIRSIVQNSKRKLLIFGDRFPFRYFVDEYGLDYYAAFPGCSSETEASVSTITFLIDKVIENNIPALLKIELSNSKVADIIAEETNTKVLELNSAHNVSLSGFESGITYVDIMKNNIKVLKEVLN